MSARVDAVASCDRVVAFGAGLNTAQPGNTLVYAIVVSNSGPSAVVNAPFSDVVPVIHDFVRLFSSGNASVEQGYNTDARPLQFNENNSHVFTHSLQLGDIPIVTVNGVVVWQRTDSISTNRISRTRLSEYRKSRRSASTI